MEDKVYKIGYEEIYKKIEVDIFGLRFEIKNLDSSKEKALENINREDGNEIDNEIENILGKNSIEKINKKIKEDGYEELTLDQKLGIIGYLLSFYSEAIVDKTINPLINTFNNATNKINDLMPQNRKSRRYMNNRNKHNKRNYRRY